MFSAIAFMPTFLQMASGTSAANSGLLMLPMMAGLFITAIGSGIATTKTGRYKVFPIAGVLVIAAAMLWMTTLSGDTSLVTICTMLFVMGLGLGLVMQVVVLVAQNAVSPRDLGTATSTNNYFREVGATLGVAVFGTVFTNRLAENLTGALQDNAQQAVAAGITSPDSLVPQAVEAAGEPLLPAFAVALLLALFLREIPLSDVAGLVARGEAVAGDDLTDPERDDDAREATPAH
jgi:MFS family permease